MPLFCLSPVRSPSASTTATARATGCGSPCHHASFRRLRLPSSFLSLLSSRSPAAYALTLPCHAYATAAPTQVTRQAAASPSSRPLTDASVTPHSPAAAATKSTPTPSTLLFYDTFALSTEDVHVILLEEAHRKHGVWMNVPPQLAPSVPGVGPPAVPLPQYPPKQKERLDWLQRNAEAAMEAAERRQPGAPRSVGGALAEETCLAYPPTHLPPPFVTTGTRSLSVGDAMLNGPDSVVNNATASSSSFVASSSTATARSGAGGAAAATPRAAVEHLLDASKVVEDQGPAGASSSVAALQTQLEEVAIREPPDPDMLFHCSSCGHAFRREAAARAHVAQRHSDDAAAVVAAGPGPGLIVGFKTVVAPPSVVMMTARGGEGGGGTQPQQEEEEKKKKKEALETTAAAVMAAAAGGSTDIAAAAATTAAAAPSPPASHRPAGAAGALSAETKSARRIVSAASYAATPAVTLPDERLIDELLLSVWDAVALGRDDIEKAASVRSTSASTGNTSSSSSASSSAAAAAAGSLASSPSQRQAPGAAAMVDSCNGRFFIPSSAFVAGTADNRAELEAELGMKKPSARATPEGAAPGVRRHGAASSSSSSLAGAGSGSAFSGAHVALAGRHRLLLQRRNADGTIGSVDGHARLDGSGHGGVGGGSGGAVGYAPTAMEMSIVELSRHYPNPFGDSPNAALVEREKEPVNPFRDLEGEMEAAAAAAGGEATQTQDSRQKAKSAVVHGGEQSAADTQRGTKSSDRDVKKGDDEAGEAEATAALWREWQTRFAARPFACPLCRRCALPGHALDERSEGPTQSAADEQRGPGTASTGRAAGGNATSSLASPPADDDAVASRLDGCSADVEAWSWYASCVPRFRLLDGLVDHLESCHAGGDGDGGDDDGNEHGTAMTDTDWSLLYALERRTNAATPTAAAAAAAAAEARAELTTVCEAYRRLHPSAQDLQMSAAATDSALDSSSSPTTRDGGAGTPQGSSTSNNDNTGTSSSDGGDDNDGDAAVSSLAGSGAVAVTEAPHLHVRSAVNIVLMGTVRDIQEGFVESTRVLQYVVAVRGPAPTNSTAAAAAQEDADGGKKQREGGEGGDGEDDVELVVVRCIGDLVPASLLHAQVRRGSTVFVTGTLRMNRNVDTLSRRSHAYPYVQVVPPLGFVKVLK